MKKQISLRWALVLVVVAIILGVGANRLISRDSIFDQIAKYRDVLSITQKFYVDTVDASKLTEAAINGLLNQLDPHSIYLPAVSTEQEKERFEGSYQGVGLEIASLNDTIVVIEPMGGGPAAGLGIMSNDRIVKVNDSTCVGQTTTQASKRLRGPKGTKVAVTIVRAGVPAPMVYEITRDNIALNSVDAAMMISEDVGYVSVNRFSGTTTAELDSCLAKLSKQGMKKLLLDLRGNPGGYLQQAEQVADLFLDGGTTAHPRTIVYTKARSPELEESYTARSGDPYEHLPLIVLINNSSASASEIVSGAIQDWDRGLIVGETSFGKGLVQHQWSLPDGSSLRLTIARYYTPSGRLIQRAYDGKDHAQYEAEAFKRTETEGDNLEHTKDTQTDSLRPQFKTSGGRIVYGGGGITPDYVVKSMDLTDFTKDILRRDFFYPYSSTLLDNLGDMLRSKYGQDYKSFASSYTLSPEVMDGFKSYMTKKKFTVDDKAFAKDQDYIATRLKAYLGRAVWGEPGWFSTMAHVDSQLQKAITLFPEAQKIAGLDQQNTGRKMN
jgi:carboxyl-terminal processing protease